MNELTVYQKSPPQELFSVLEQHQKEGDPFSGKLLSWGAGVLREVVNYGKAELPDEARRVEIIATKTDVLRRLTWDPFSNRPIQNLVFDGNRPWEKEVYFDCLQVCRGVSPFDQAPMLMNPLPHLFAQKILAWARLYLPPLTEPDQLGPSPMSVLSGPAFVEMKRFAYQKIGQGVVVEERLEEVRSELEEWLGKAKQLVQDIQTEVEVAIEQANQGIFQSREELVQKMEWVQKVYQGTMGEFEQQKEWRDRVFDEKLAQLRAARQSQQQESQAAIHSMDQRIATLEAERKKEYDQYSQQFDQLKKAMDLTVQSLHAQINSNQQQWKNEAAAKQREHDADASATSAKLSAIGQRAEQLCQQIHHVENRGAELNRQNQQHLGTIHQLSNQLQGLQNDLNGLPARSSTRLFGVNF